MKSTTACQVPDWKEVDEEYTITEQRAEVRDKEVWVKKVSVRAPPPQADRAKTRR